MNTFHFLHDGSNKFGSLGRIKYFYVAKRFNVFAIGIAKYIGQLTVVIGMQRGIVQDVSLAQAGGDLVNVDVFTSVDGQD